MRWSMNELLKKRIPHSIILEDDAILTNHFIPLNEVKILENESIDMGFLYHNQCRVTKKKHYLGSLNYYKVAFMPFSTTAYYINLEVAKTLHRATRKISYTADFPIAINRLHHVVAFCPRVVRHPTVTKSQTYMNKESIPNKKNALMLYFCLGYWCNKAYYGSFGAYLKRWYFHQFYQNASPNIDGK